MSVVEEVLSKVKDVRTRVLTTIDQFRPKLLYKKPLTEFKILGGQILEGEGVSTIVNRVRTAVENLRKGLGVLSETSSTEVTTTGTVSSQITRIMKEKERKAIHY